MYKTDMFYQDVGKVIVIRTDKLKIDKPSPKSYIKGILYGVKIIVENQIGGKKMKVAFNFIK